LTGQGPAARVVYRATSGHIEEPASSGGSWSAVDLTALTGAPAAASASFGFTTTLTGQGPAARVVYRTAGRHIEELALPSGGAGQADELTAVSGAPDSASAPSRATTGPTRQVPAARAAPAPAGAPVGYPAGLTGQVPAAGVVYRAAGNDIEELSAG